MTPEGGEGLPRAGKAESKKVRFGGLKYREKLALYHALDDWFSSHGESDEMYVVATRLQREIAASLWRRPERQLVVETSHHFGGRGE